MKLPNNYSDCKTHGQRIAWALAANGIKLDKVRMSKFGGVFLYYTTKSGYKGNAYFTPDDIATGYSEVIRFMKGEMAL